MSITIAGRPIGPVGLGMIAFNRTAIHGKPHGGIDHSISVLKQALSRGGNFWDGAYYYGTPDFNSLHILNAYFTKYPEDASKVCISIKGCFGSQPARCFNDAEGVKDQIEKCLEILDGKCRIDVFSPARLDPEVPVEVTVSAVAEYVKAGKIGGVGLSECSAQSIRRAVAVHPIAAVEIEMSLFETSPLTNGIAEACREHDIPIVAYTPLGKGFLTGELRTYEDLAENDSRRMFPRFHPENFDQNVKLVGEIEKIAQAKRCTIAQVAIAWVAAQTSKIGAPVIPIPGISSAARADENLTLVKLTESELRELDTILKTFEVKGARHPAVFQKFTAV